MRDSDKEIDLVKEKDLLVHAGLSLISAVAATVLVLLSLHIFSGTYALMNYDSDPGSNNNCMDIVVEQKKTNSFSELDAFSSVRLNEADIDRSIDRIGACPYQYGSVVRVIPVSLILITGTLLLFIARRHRRLNNRS